MNTYECFELNLTKEDASRVREIADAAKVEPSAVLKRLVEEALKSSMITDGIKRSYDALRKISG